MRRELRRRRAFAELGLDVDSLPLGLQHQLLRRPPQFPLEVAQRKRLVTALVMRGLQQQQVALVLNLISDRPCSTAELEQWVAAAAEQHERDVRPGENFSVVACQRHAGRPGYYTLQLRLDGPRIEEVSIPISAADLTRLTRFQALCVLHLDFVPLFKPHVTQRQYERYVAALLDQLREEPHAAET